MRSPYFLQSSGRRRSAGGNEVILTLYFSFPQKWRGKDDTDMMRSTSSVTCFSIVSLVQPVKPDIPACSQKLLIAGSSAVLDLASAGCPEAAVWVLLAVCWQWGEILLELQEWKKQLCSHYPSCLPVLLGKLLWFARQSLYYQKSLYFQEAFRLFLSVASSRTIVMKQGM